MTEQQKFEAWANAKFGPAPGAIPQNERYASLFEVWQARAAQDKSAELLEALVDVLGWFPGRQAWHTDEPIKAVERARAAISKARGE